MAPPDTLESRDISDFRLSLTQGPRSKVVPIPEVDEDLMTS